MKNSKPWYTSWTILANLIGVAIVALQLILGGHLVVDPEVQALLLAVLNLLLRLRTSQPIST